MSRLTTATLTIGTAVGTDAVPSVGGDPRDRRPDMTTYTTTNAIAAKTAPSKSRNFPPRDFMAQCLHSIFENTNRVLQVNTRIAGPSGYCMAFSLTIPAG